MNQTTLTLKETQLDRIERKLDLLLERKDPVKAKASINYTPEFEALWKQYPGRGPGTSNPKKNAYNAYRARLREDYSHEQMLKGVIAYRKCCEAKKIINTEMVMQASRFLGPNIEFDNDWTPPPERLRLPSADAQLVPFAMQHGLPQPGHMESYFDYRKKLQRELENRV